MHETLIWMQSCNYFITKIALYRLLIARMNKVIFNYCLITNLYNYNLKIQIFPFNINLVH